MLKMNIYTLINVQLHRFSAKMSCLFEKLFIRIQPAKSKLYKTVVKTYLKPKRLIPIRHETDL